VKRAFVIAVSLVALCGCKSGPTCPVQVRTDPVHALSDHETSRAQWQTLKVEARVTQWGSRGRIRGTVLMFLEQPNRIRFDVMSQVGPVAVLTSDGESFQLSDLRERTFLYGPTCPQNIARLLGVSVPAEQVVRLLTGGTSTIDALDQSIECRDGLYVVTLHGADGSTQEVAFSVVAEDRPKPPHQQRLQLRRSTEWAPDGAKRWEATYDDYIDVDGQSFPTNVRFLDETNDADTAIRVKSIVLDPAVPEGAFRQTPAPGMTVELAYCS
jgi:outer membrane lipoprotein-sorting protein